MAICEPQISLGLDLSPSYPQAYPASRLPWPGSDEARMMIVGSGMQCSMLLSESSPLGLFSRILLGSFLWTNSEEFCYVWERLDTRFDCSAFQLTALGQSTEGSASLLLGTPDTSQPGPNGQKSSLINTLDRMKLWPTPNAGNFNDGESLETWEARREKNKAKGINGNGQGTPLAVAARLWPTPDARDSHPEGLDAGKRRLEKYSTLGLQTAAKLWPTPRNDHSGLESHGVTYLGGSLNPRFVEELMGFPIDHTDLKHSETP